MGLPQPLLQTTVAVLLAAAWLAQLPTARAEEIRPPKIPTPAAAAAPEAPPAPPPDPAIPLPAIAEQSEQLDHTMEKITRHLSAAETAANPAIPSTESLAASSTLIAERARLVEDFLGNSPDLLQLRDKAAYWRTLDSQYGSHQKSLKLRETELEGDILVLDEAQTRWRATQEKLRDTAGIDLVGARVAEKLDAIGGLRSRVAGQLNEILTLENRISQIQRVVSGILGELAEAQTRFRSRLFEADGASLWAAGAFHGVRQSLTAMLRESADENYTTARVFLVARARAALLLPLLYILTVLSIFWLRHALKPEQRSGILGAPFSLGLLAVLVAGIFMLGGAPVGISLLLYSLWLALVFRLTPFLIHPALHSIVYAVLILIVLESARVCVAFPPPVDRPLTVAILIGAPAVLLWLARPSRLRRLGLSAGSLRVWQVLAGVPCLILGVALAANIFGFVSLSRLLGFGTLAGAFLAIALYCTIRVILLLLTLFLCSRWASSMSAAHRASIDHWARRALIVAAVLVWCAHSQLYLLFAHDALTRAKSAVLAYSLTLGKMSMTVGGIVGVILILGIGYGIAKGTSSMLRGVLSARLAVDRGLPYAISKVTYYCLMLLVAAAALSSTGVELDRFTLITGALGLGVGFGLQNIVSNFASGLILLFERPIRIGDTVEVSGRIGVVSRIGARSSSLSTPQGAELIVPNSDLLSNHVLNWSLSSRGRRIEIPVRVAYGSDPEAVLKVLTEAAAAQPNVLRMPAPQGLILGFGESALNLELRFWCAREDLWAQLTSDVAHAVHRALGEAGIEIPFPQRDLHLHGLDWPVTRKEGEGGASTALADGS